MEKDMPLDKSSGYDCITVIIFIIKVSRSKVV